MSVVNGLYYQVLKSSIGFTVTGTTVYATLPWYPQSTIDELNNMLKDNQNVKDLKELYDMGLGSRDFHWRNFGYKDSQLKILDLGI